VTELLEAAVAREDGVGPDEALQGHGKPADPEAEAVAPGGLLAFVEPEVAEELIGLVETHPLQHEDGGHVAGAGQGEPRHHGPEDGVVGVADASRPPLGVVDDGRRGDRAPLEILAPCERPQTPPSYIISARAGGWTKRPATVVRLRKAKSKVPAGRVS